MIPFVRGWRLQTLEGGLFLVCAALPLAFLPAAVLPFADAKPVLLTLGAALVWISGIRPDPRLVPPVLALALIAVAAAVVGTDPLESMYGTAASTRGPTGLVMLLPALALMVVAPSIPPPIRERMRRWIVGAAMIAAAFALIEHVAPGVLDPILRTSHFIGGTFGNPVIFAGFLALALGVSLAGVEIRWRWLPGWVTFLVLGSAFGVVGERSAYLLPVVAVGVAWWLGRPDRRRFNRAVAALVLGIVVWSFVPKLGDDAASGSGSGSGSGEVLSQFETTLGERQRLAVVTAIARGVLERPFLGWGPGNAWTAFLSSGTPEEIRTATRTWGDAHDLPLQFAVTTGIVGSVALLWLTGRVLLAARPRSAIVPWAAAGALTLLAFSLYEPLDPTLTPLLFFLAGASLSSATATARTESRANGIARVVVVGALGAGVIVSALSLASSVLEQWGRSHYASRWALEDAVTIAPWRLTAIDALAIDLALDGRSGDDAAAERARSLVADAVRDHPDNPGVRLVAVDVEVLLRDEDAARGWLDRQLERFPSDTVRIPAAGSNTLGPG
jgi:hypothetical protein